MPDSQRAAVLAKRDLTLDLVRVVCLLTVVAAHVCFVALRRTPDGGIQNWTPPQEWAFFPVGTWFIQPMPLFFVIGGCVGSLAWRSAERRGEDAFGFFRLRLLRFAQPAAALFVVLGVVFGGAVLLGVPVDLADAASYGVGTPIWFVGAYLLCQAMVPAMVAAHRRHPLLALGLLAGGAVLVDVVRAVVGVPAIGLLNYLFVWPFAQQVGIWLTEGPLALGRPADGTRGDDAGDRRVTPPGRVLLLVWAAAMAVTAVVASVDPAGPDMLQNQIPPTVPLLSMTVAHTAGYLFLRPWLRRVCTHRVVLGVLALVGGRAMTIYLWHAAFVIGIAAALFFLPGMPQAPSPVWWLLRVPVYVVVLGLVLLLSIPMVRLERGPDPAGLPTSGRAGIRLLIVVAGVLTVIPAFLTTIPGEGERLRGLDLELLLAGAGMLVAALVLLRVGPRAGRANSAAPAARGESAEDPGAALDQ